MRWPWRRQRGGRHAWGEFDLDAEGIYWRCRQCGRESRECDEYFDPLPEFGCHELPIVAAASVAGDELPVVRAE